MRSTIHASEGSLIRCLQDGVPLPMSLLDGGIPLPDTRVGSPGAGRCVSVTPDGLVRLPVFSKVQAVQSTVYGMQAASRLVVATSRRDIWAVMIRRAPVDARSADLFVADMRMLQERHPHQTVIGWLVTTDGVRADAAQAIRAAGHVVSSGIPAR